MPLKKRTEQPKEADKALAQLSRTRNGYLTLASAFDEAGPEESPSSGGVYGSGSFLLHWISFGNSALIGMRSWLYWTASKVKRKSHTKSQQSTDSE